MYVQLCDSKIAELKTGKKLSCVAIGENGIPGNRVLPFIVAYHEIGEERRKLDIFSCKAFETTKTTMIADLTYCGKIADSDEPTRYFFLKWFLKELIASTDRGGKERLVVITALPHFTEIVADLDFDSLSVANAGRFKGIKLFKQNER